MVIRCEEVRTGKSVRARGHLSFFMSGADVVGGKAGIRSLLAKSASLGAIPILGVGCCARLNTALQLGLN